MTLAPSRGTSDTRRTRSRGRPEHRGRAHARTLHRSRGTSPLGSARVGADTGWLRRRVCSSRAHAVQCAASGGERLLPMLPVGMDIDVRVLVMERGLGLTHDLTLACRHAGVSVLGPVRDAAEARAAAEDVPVDVLVIELTGPSVQAIREVTQALGGV